MLLNVIFKNFVRSLRDFYFTMKSSPFMITLTNVLMDNFCPSFFSHQILKKNINRLKVLFLESSLFNSCF